MSAGMDECGCGCVQVWDGLRGICLESKVLGG